MNTENLTKGMTRGMIENIDNIRDYIEPMLRDLGYGVSFIRGDDEVDTFRNLKDYRTWSTFAQRFLPKGSGLLIRIYNIEKPTHCIIAQAWVVPNYTKSEILKDKPRLNIPKNIVDTTSEDQRIAVVWGICDVMDIHYLIYDYRHKAFALDKFTAVPIDGWRLTYRHNKERKNRMSIKGAHQIKMFKPLSQLPDALRLKLNMK